MFKVNTAYLLITMSNYLPIRRYLKAKLLSYLNNCFNKVNLSDCYNY